MSRSTELAKQIPWVTRLKKPRPCDSLRWGEVPLKALYSMNGKSPTGTEGYECKSPGYWKFKASKRSNAKSGIYCWQHLLYSGIYHDYVEQTRLARWAKRHENGLT